MRKATVSKARSSSGAEKKPLVSEGDRKDIEKLYDALRTGKTALAGLHGESTALPGSLHQFLVDLGRRVNDGQAVVIVRNEAHFTTMKAAGVLGVSRQFLVNLLEKGEIPFHMVGTHRRVYAKDLLNYKSRRDVNRRRVLRELSRAEASEGLYDRVPALVDES
jgi:excisionase family DNA binding protein